MLNNSLSSTIDRLFYDPRGQMIVSAIFGLALSLMFRRVCKDNCILFFAPHIDDVTNKTFELEGSCYKYIPHNIKCEKTDMIIKPYDVNVEPDNKIQEKTMFSNIMNN